MTGITTAGGNGRTWAAVLFDLDGTIADTLPLILRCYRHTMLTHLGRELPDEAFLRTVGTPLGEQLRDFARDEAELLAMAETYVAFQRIHHDAMVKAYPGARDVASALRGRGVELAVVTSKRREMTLRTLDRCGLGDLFEVLVCADDVSRGKPDPEPVRRALAELGLERHRREVLFVGDSPFDVTAGRLAEVRTAAALWGAFERATLEAAEPDHLVGCIADVLELRPG